MIENGINIKEPVTDKETVSFVLSLLSNNKQSFGILGLPRLISQKNISLLLQDAKILPIEKTGAERSIIGLVVLSTVDEPNESVLFSLFFKPDIKPETIGYSINQIKDYFLNRGLTKISAVFPNPSETINIMEACGFIKEAVLVSCFKTREGFQNGILLSFANDGRKITPLLDSASSVKTEKGEMAAKRIEALKTEINRLKKALQKTEAKKPDSPEEKTIKTESAATPIIQERLETDELEKFVTQKLGVIAEHTNRNRFQKLIRLIEIVTRAAADEKVTKEKLQTHFDCSPATIENLLKILRDAEIIKIGREKIGGKSLAIIRLTEITAAELESIKKVQEITKKPLLADEKQPEKMVREKDENSQRQPQEPEKTKDETAKPEVQEQKNETSAWNKNSATVYIDKQQTEKAKRFLKANLKREKIQKRKD